jgi:hypothetical protein
MLGACLHSHAMARSHGTQHELTRYILAVLDDIGVMTSFLCAFRQLHAM